ncbi:MAG: hypothetical protein WA760_07365, partial [Pseudolabrys sp.]
PYDRITSAAFGRGIGLNTVLQQNWQIYAMAVIVGFVTVMVMRWWRFRRASSTPFSTSAKSSI